MKIEIRPEWLMRKQDGATVALPALLRLLTKIREQGSIRNAAETVDLSYRHAWGLLQEFERQFGATLVQKYVALKTGLSSALSAQLLFSQQISASAARGALQPSGR